MPRYPWGIVTLLAAHPEGLRAEQIRGQLAAGKPIGDLLRGMERMGVVRVERSGKALRYFAARQAEPPSPHLALTPGDGTLCLGPGGMLARSDEGRMKAAPREEPVPPFR